MFGAVSVLFAQVSLRSLRTRELLGLQLGEFIVERTLLLRLQALPARGVRGEYETEITKWLGADAAASTRTENDKTDNGMGD